MRKCPECGFDVNEDSVDCSKCGFDFKEKDSEVLDLESIYKSELDPLRDKIKEKYDVVGFLGKGGFSTVFKLKDKTLDRFCALKILSKDLLVEKEMVERFKMEARLYAKLEHPNIVQVYDVGFYNNVAYIIMKYIDGIDLKEYIKKYSPIELKNIISISKDISSVLEYMHSKGIVHRDIKPANVMIQESDNRAVLTDFGLAKSLGTTKFTVTGKVMGSPHYLAPEQAKGDPVDSKTDIYSMGITMFEMATGKVPFGGETPIQVVIKHIREQIPKPSTVYMNVHRYLEKIILRATKKTPSERYLSMEGLKKDLEKLERITSKEGEKVKERRKRPVRLVISISIVVVAIFAVLYFTGTFFSEKKDNIITSIPKKSSIIEDKQKKPTIKREKKKEEKKEIKKKEVKIEPKKTDNVIIPKKKREIKNLKIPVIINSNAKAEIFVNGQSRGTVPPEIKIPLLPGKHKVMFVKSGRGSTKTEIKEIEIKDKTKSLNVDHKFEIYARIERIIASPWGNVFIDGKPRGMTPIGPVRVLEGSHIIKIVNPKFEPFVKEITVNGGDVIPVISPKLKKILLKKEKKEEIKFSFIKLIHVSPWGKVYIDGKDFGISPVRNVKLSVGEHTIRVEHPNFKAYTKRIKVEEGKDIQKINIRLKERK